MARRHGGLVYYKSKGVTRLPLSAVDLRKFRWSLRICVCNIDAIAVMFVFGTKDVGIRVSVLMLACVCWRSIL